MRKTIITCVSIVTVGAVVVSLSLIDARKKIALKTETSSTSDSKSDAKSQSQSKDRFTVCIETVMTKSVEAKQPISAQEAKDICLHAEKF